MYLNVYANKAIIIRTRMLLSCFCFDYESAGVLECNRDDDQMIET